MLSAGKDVEKIQPSGTEMGNLKSCLRLSLSDPASSSLSSHKEIGRKAFPAQPSFFSLFVFFNGERENVLAFALVFIPVRNKCLLFLSQPVYDILAIAAQTH